MQKQQTPYFVSTSNDLLFQNIVYKFSFSYLASLILIWKRFFAYAFQCIFILNFLFVIVFFLGQIFLFKLNNFFCLVVCSILHFLVDFDKSENKQDRNIYHSSITCTLKSSSWQMYLDRVQVKNKKTKSMNILSIYMARTLRRKVGESQ